MLIKSEQSNFFSVRLYHWYQTTEYMCQIKIILGGKSQPKEIDSTRYKAMHGNGPHRTIMTVLLETVSRIMFLATCMAEINS